MFTTSGWIQDAVAQHQIKDLISTGPSFKTKGLYETHPATNLPRCHICDTALEDNDVPLPISQ